MMPETPRLQHVAQYYVERLPPAQQAQLRHPFLNPPILQHLTHTPNFLLYQFPITLRHHRKLPPHRSLLTPLLSGP